MIAANTKFTNNKRKVDSTVDKSNFRNFGHAGASTSKLAKSKVSKSKQPSRRGQPPHTAGIPGQNIRGAIRFSSSREDVVIGPIHSFVGTSMEAHEKGIVYRGQDFPERALMLPSLAEAAPRFMAGWRIG